MGARRPRRRRRPSCESVSAEFQVLRARLLVELRGGDGRVGRRREVRVAGGARLGGVLVGHVDRVLRRARRRFRRRLEAVLPQDVLAEPLRSGLLASAVREEARGRSSWCARARVWCAASWSSSGRARACLQRGSTAMDEVLRLMGGARASFLDCRRTEPFACSGAWLVRGTVCGRALRDATRHATLPTLLPRPTRGPRARARSATHLKLLWRSVILEQPQPSAPTLCAPGHRRARRVASRCRPQPSSAPSRPNPTPASSSSSDSTTARLSRRSRSCTRRRARERPDHGVRLVPNRLRHGLRRANGRHGVPGQFDGGRDPRASLARRARGADARLPLARLERRLHGHGRAAQQLSARPRGAARARRALGDAAVADHRVDRRRRRPHAHARRRRAARPPRALAPRSRSRRASASCRARRRTRCTS